MRSARCRGAVSVNEREASRLPVLLCAAPDVAASTTLLEPGSAPAEVS